MGRTVEQIQEQIRQEWQEIERLRDLRADRFKDRAELVAEREQIRRIIHRKKSRARDYRDGEHPKDWDAEKVAAVCERLADDVEQAEDRFDQLTEQIEVKSNLIEKVQNRIGRDRKRAARLRRIVKAKKRARANKDRVGKTDFFWAEMDCRDGTKMPSNARPAVQRHCERVLQPIRNAYGQVRMTSAYRTRTYDAAIGGVGGYHVGGYEDSPEYPATDIVPASGSVDSWANKARSIYASFGGVGRYYGSGFVHIDPRPYVSNWTG